MAGYTRNDTGNNIADGNVINASDLDGEYNAIEAAFNASTGHTHDGTSAEGAPIEVAGPAQDLVITATEVRPKTDNTLDLGTNTLEFKDLYLDGTANIDSLVADTADINAGTIDSTTIGGSTPAAGTFTTLTANGNVVLGDAATDTVTVTADVASDLIPSADNTYDLGASGSEWKDLYIDGTANIDSLVADTADINGGSVDGATLGTNSAITEAQIDNININGNAITSTDTNGNIALTPDGTGEVDISKVDIDSGTIDSTTIGGSTPAAGSFTGLTLTGDATFGDNDKAIFGAGSDLQIYHDGSDSIIADVGTGNLSIQGTELRLRNADNTADYITCNDGGDVKLKYANANKLVTTDTGIDVTGTVTADGLTVDSAVATITNDDVDNGATLRLDNANTGSNWGLGKVIGTLEYYLSTDTSTSEPVRAKIELEQNNSSTTYPSNADLNFYTTSVNTLSKNMSISSDGDISFYEDTGTTPKLFWDASAESLGIGTTSPNRTLTVSSSSGVPAELVSSSSNSLLAFFDSGTGTRPSIGSAGSNLVAYTNSAERMRIDSSGNVLVRTTSTTINTSNFGTAILDTLRHSRDATGGSATAQFYGNAGECRILGDGDILNTNGNYGTISDIKFKQNITDANSQWDDIKAIQVRNYELIDYPDRRHIGVVAQELETVCPNLVKDNDPEYWQEGDELPEGVSVGDVKEEGYKSVAYSILYMKAVKALQEAMTRIETLEAEVAALKNG